MTETTRLLTDAETSLIRRVHACHGALPRELRDGLVQLLVETRILLTSICAPGASLTASQVALLGLVRRIHQLLAGGVQGLTDANGHVWGVCLRGLLESFGASSMALEQPDRLRRLIESPGISAGRLRNAAKARLCGLADDFRRLDPLVHPGSASMLFGTVAGDSDIRTAYFAVPPPMLNRGEIEEGLTCLLRAAGLVYGDVHLLLEQHLAQITKGKSVMSIAKVGSDRGSTP